MDGPRYRALGGASFVASGALLVLGMIVAEALYPGYSVSTQTISALGAAEAPSASRTVFNGAMVAGGLLALVGAGALHRVYRRRALTGVVAVTAGVGLVGVGLFPTQTGPPHVVAALVAFGGIGASALVAGATVAGPFRAVSAVLGGLELLALGAFMAFARSNPLGVGGLERVVAALGIVWLLAFGGSLVPAGARDGWEAN